jgi:L-ascorbate metabolism protein UlaG (beta-lactamase superfamily)
VVIVAPLGCDIVIKKSFSFYAGQKIITFNWWDSFIIYEDIVLTALPAIHWSQSNFFDRNKILWASWMIKIKDKHVYIAGDTAYGDHFSLIQSFFPSIDLACLPIAPYEPKDIQIDSHMNVEESYKAFKDLDAHFFMPIHWGVFAYGDEKLKDPIKQIILLMKNKNKLSSLVSTVYNQSFVLL